MDTAKTRQRIDFSIRNSMHHKEYRQWKEIGEQLAVQSEKLSLAYFSSLPESFDLLHVMELRQLFNALQVIVSEDIQKALDFYHLCPAALLKMHPDIRDKVLGACIHLSEKDATTLMRTFDDCVEVLSTLNFPDQERFSQYLIEIGNISVDAAKAFLANAAQVFDTIRDYFLSDWVAQGLFILKNDFQTGIDYFSLTGKQGRAALSKWEAAVAYEDVAEVLSVYATGLCGKKMQFEKVDIPQNIHRFYPLFMTGNKNKILIPPYYAIGHNRSENFLLYKTAVALQAGYIEFQTFNQKFKTIEDGLGRFQQPNLASVIFFIIEDGRILRMIGKQYRGLKPQMDHSLALGVQKRPVRYAQPIDHAFEALLRLTLGDSWGGNDAYGIEGDDLSIEKTLDGFYEKAASSWDSFLKTSEIYHCLVPLFEKNRNNRMRQQQMQRPPALAEVPFPGNLKKDVDTVTDGDTGDDNITQLVPLKKVLLKKNTSKESLPGNPQEEAADFQSMNGDYDLAADDIKDSTHILPMRIVGTAGDEGSFYYDEWDYAFGVYRKKWCRAFERTAKSGHVDSYKKITDHYSLLIRQVKKQFERIKPIQIYPVKKVEWGEELDLDAVISWAVDRKNGKSPSNKLFVRKEKKPQKTAVMLLVDLSASTNEWIKVPDASPDCSATDKKQDAFSLNRRLPENKKIIDILIEALVVILEGFNLKTAGKIEDQVSVMGFSGQGRHQVDLFSLKGFSEPLNEAVKGKICNITSRQSTRMGCAIRHAAGKLRKIEAETRLLILLSDGLPQDADYGEDRKSKTYAIHDTLMAFAELKRDGIQNFCITVDNTGNDHLKFVSDPKNYLLIQDARCLPSVLPKIVESLIS